MLWEGCRGAQSETLFADPGVRAPACRLGSATNWRAGLCPSECQWASALSQRCRGLGGADSLLSVQAWGAPRTPLETLLRACSGRCRCTSAARCSCSCSSWAASRPSGPQTGCSASWGASHHNRELSVRVKTLQNRWMLVIELLYSASSTVPMLAALFLVE